MNLDLLTSTPLSTLITVVIAVPITAATFMGYLHLPGTELGLLHLILTSTLKVSNIIPILQMSKQKLKKAKKPA